MTGQGWHKLLTDVPRYGKANPYRIPAYSEMMPAPLIGWRPYGGNHPAPCRPDNPDAWLVRDWFVRVRPTNLEAERAHLVTGDAAVERYKARIQELKVNCLRCIE